MILTLTSALLLLATNALAWEYVPVYSGSLMGGQYFMNENRANLNANASVLAAPILKFGGGRSLIPLYSGSYQGNKDVTDGVGPGTLYQQQMDHRLSLSAILTRSNSTWKLKPSVSYKREFLRETRDETWGHGLFDYEKIGLGLAVENVYHDPFSYSIAFDVYRIRFPNFQSLESNAGVDPQGNPLGRELLSRNVLDSYNYQLSASLSRPFPYDAPKVSLQLGYSALLQSFVDQRIVDSRGQFENTQRVDVNNTVSAGVLYPRPLRLGGREYRLGSSFGVSAAYNRSNQNTFDAGFTQFVPKSYSYLTLGAGPGLSLAWGDSKHPTSVSVSLRASRTQYEGRLARTNSGVYTSHHQYQDYYSTGVSYSHPIASDLRLKAQTNFLWAKSNTAYEKTYTYTYGTASYLLGLTYEY